MDTLPSNNEQVLSAVLGVELSDAPFSAAIGTAEDFTDDLGGRGFSGDSMRDFVLITRFSILGHSSSKSVMTMSVSLFSASAVFGSGIF